MVAMEFLSSLKSWRLMKESKKKNTIFIMWIKHIAENLAEQALVYLLSNILVGIMELKSMQSPKKVWVPILF